MCLPRPGPKLRLLRMRERGALLLRPLTEGAQNMVRSAASKVMWVGRATVFLVGIAVIVGLVFGAASVAPGSGALRVRSR